MVNVYDDVLADKAQAIMLLANGGRSLVSSVLKFPNAVQASTPPIFTPKTSLSLQTANGARDLSSAITTTASGPSQNPTQTHEMHTLRKIQTMLSWRSSNYREALLATLSGEAYRQMMLLRRLCRR